MRNLYIATVLACVCLAGQSPRQETRPAESNATQAQKTEVKNENVTLEKKPGGQNERKSAARKVLEPSGQTSLKSAARKAIELETKGEASL